MKNSKHTQLNKKNIEKYQINLDDQKEIKGGFLFQMVDNIRCEFDRIAWAWSRGNRRNRNGNGNGDGDW